jgi:nucleoid-associated protein YgaU
MKRLSYFLILITVGLSCLGFAFAKGDAAHYRRERVMVYSGDSLWSIASRRTADDEDVRAVIERIVRENKLDPARPIQAGQVLTVPVREIPSRQAVR